MSRVLVLGALHHDVVVEAPRLPRLDETLVGTSVDYRFGGKGGNQALAAARLGAAVSMIGRVGSDAAGAVLLEALDSAGVERSGVRAVPGASGMSVAVTEPQGGYGAVIVSAANLENDGTDGLPEDTSICVLQNEVPEAANLTLARRLPGTARLIYNAAPARKADPDLLARCDIVIVNRIEAGDLTGEGAPEAALMSLLEAGPKGVIVTLGEDGALLARGEGVKHFPAHPVHVHSTHGAGDMFTGGVAAALAGGHELTYAVRYGQAAAALAVSRDVEARKDITAETVRRFLG